MTSPPTVHCVAALASSRHLRLMRGDPKGRWHDRCQAAFLRQSRTATQLPAGQRRAFRWKTPWPSLSRQCTGTPTRLGDVRTRRRRQMPCAESARISLRTGESHRLDRRSLVSRSRPFYLDRPSRRALLPRQNLVILLKRQRSRLRISGGPLKLTEMLDTPELQILWRSDDRKGDRSRGPAAPGDLQPRRRSHRQCGYDLPITGSIGRPSTPGSVATTSSARRASDPAQNVPR